MADPLSTALVTGGAGFIGSHLVERLLDDGVDVRILDDLSSGHRRNVPARATLFEGSILDDAARSAACAGCDAVFHLAAMVSVPQSVAEPSRCFDVNVNGTAAMLATARAMGVRRFVFASSSAVYGPEPSLPSSENDPIRCASPYAASKAAGEAFVAAYGRCYELGAVSLRFFNVYGPRQDPRSPYAAAISAFADATKAGRSPRIFGDGQQTRDFVHVTDVADACVRAARAPGLAAGEPINIGSGRRVTLLDVLTAMDAPPPAFEPPRAGDVRHSAASIDRARERLAFEPKVALRDGLRALLIAP